PHVSGLLPLAEAAGAQVLLLSEQTDDMRATVERGLAWLEEQFHPGRDDAWLLVPADHPTLDPAVVRQLLAARAAYPEASMLVPVTAGRRGHPVLLEWRHVAGIRTLPAGLGLNAYMRQHGADTLEMPVHSPQVLCDLDTPEDYERLRKSWPLG